MATKNRLKRKRTTATLAGTLPVNHDDQKYAFNEHELTPEQQESQRNVKEAVQIKDPVLWYEQWSAEWKGHDVRGVIVLQCIVGLCKVSSTASSRTLHMCTCPLLSPHL
jgi:hypothetical protein